MLMRHAKSSWDDQGLPDVERPLAPRGRLSAPLVARHLRKQGLNAGSRAVLPRRPGAETWQLMSPVLCCDIACKILRSLYPGAPAGCWKRCAAPRTRSARLMLIGHNPGLATFAASLAGTGPTRPCSACGASS